MQHQHKLTEYNTNFLQKQKRNKLKQTFAFHAKFLKKMFPSITNSLDKMHALFLTSVKIFTKGHKEFTKSALLSKKS